MNRIIIFLSGILILSCAHKENQPEPENETVTVEHTTENNGPFSLDLGIENTNGVNYLTTNIDFDSAAFVVSPLSQDSVYGPFVILLDANNYISLTDSLVEIPASVEEYDPVLEKQARFVRVNTTFKQPFNISSADDFEVTGMVWFVLEPSCVPYDNNFKIRQEAGELTIEKTSTKISDEYYQ